MVAATIDYEKEYDNRGRVKEHPEIFARWDREAAAYREHGRANGAQFGVSYGPSARQIYDYFPAKNEGKDTPLAMFIHGGYWRSLEPAKFSQTAKGANAQGVSVAVAGYDLCPNVSIMTMIEQMRAATLALWRKHRKRVMVYGHSAGAHLAAAMLAHDFSKFASDAPADLVPVAYAISGIYDLTPLLHVSQNADLRLTPEEAKRVSVVQWAAPANRTLDAIVGGNESSEFLRQSRIIVDAWGQRGVATRYEAVPGKDHFTVVDALTDPGSTMTARVVELARRAQAMSL